MLLNKNYEGYNAIYKLKLYTAEIDKGKASLIFNFKNVKNFMALDLRFDEANCWRIS